MLCSCGKLCTVHVSPVNEGVHGSEGLYTHSTVYIVLSNDTNVDIEPEHVIISKGVGNGAAGEAMVSPLFVPLSIERMSNTPAPPPF